MTDKERDRIANYAIDNKISLEEAEEICRSYKEEAEKEKELEGAYLSQEEIDNGHFAADGELSPEEGKAWTRYQQIQKELAKLYDEYTSTGEEFIKRHADEITKEEMDWVEVQLKQIDNIEL